MWRRWGRERVKKRKARRKGIQHYILRKLSRNYRVWQKQKKIIYRKRTVSFCYKNCDIQTIFNTWNFEKSFMCRKYLKEKNLVYEFSVYEFKAYDYGSGYSALHVWGGLRGWEWICCSLWLCNRLHSLGNPWVQFQGLRGSRGVGGSS